MNRTLLNKKGSLFNLTFIMAEIRVARRHGQASGGSEYLQLTNSTTRIPMDHRQLKYFVPDRVLCIKVFGASYVH